MDATPHMLVVTHSARVQAAELARAAPVLVLLLIAGLIWLLVGPAVMRGAR